MKALSRGLLLAGLAGLLGLAALTPRFTAQFASGPGSDLPPAAQARVNRASLALYRLYRASATARPLAPGDPFPVRALLGEGASSLHSLGPRVTLVVLGAASCQTCDAALGAVLGRVPGLKAYRLVSQGTMRALHEGRVTIVNARPPDAALDGAPFASSAAAALGAVTDQAAFVLDSGGTVRYAQYVPPDAGTLLSAVEEVARTGRTGLRGTLPPVPGQAWPGGGPEGPWRLVILWDGRRDPDLVAAERGWLADGAAVTVVTPDDGRHADGVSVLASDPPAAGLAWPSRPCAVVLRAGRVVGVVPGYRVFSNDARAVFSAAAFFKAVNFALASARRGP